MSAAEPAKPLPRIELESCVMQEEYTSCVSVAWNDLNFVVQNCSDQLCLFSEKSLTWDMIKLGFKGTNVTTLLQSYKNNIM